MISRILRGFSIVIDGRMVLREVPGLKVWLLAPFLIQGSMMGLGMYWGIGEIKLLILKMFEYLNIQTTGWAGQIFYFLIFIVFGIIFCALFFYFIYLITMIVASPFYSIITEKILLHRGVISSKANLGATIKSILKMLKVSILKGILFGIIGAILFLFSFIPVVNFLCAFATFLIISYDISDFALETLEFGLNKRVSFFRSHAPEYIGLALFISLTAVLPGLILVLMPFAVMGASDFVGREILTKSALQAKNDSK